MFHLEALAERVPLTSIFQNMTLIYHVQRLANVKKIAKFNLPSIFSDILKKKEKKKKKKKKMFSAKNRIFAIECIFLYSFLPFNSVIWRKIYEYTRIYNLKHIPLTSFDLVREK